jgi:hypothetical protein
MPTTVEDRIAEAILSTDITFDCKETTIGELMRTLKRTIEELKDYGSDTKISMDAGCSHGASLTVIFNEPIIQ